MPHKNDISKAVLRDISEYVKLRTPEVLRVVGEMSKWNGTDKMTMRQIDEVIKEARAARKKR